MILSRGKPADSATWQELYWVYTNEADTAAAHMAASNAIRQKRADDLWYITHGLQRNLSVISGPHPSLEAAAMLIEMGAIEL